MGSGHDHSHGHLKGKKLGLSIALNLLIAVAQLAGGFLSGSLALLSDALHNFSDVIALVISYVAEKLTRKAFTRKQTFGYKRAEIIAALVNAVSLMAIALMLIKEAVFRFHRPAEIDTFLVIVLAFFSIAVNGGSAMLLKTDASRNMNIRSAYLHLVSDMVTSIAVLAGGVAMYRFQIFWIDSVLSVMISGYLIYSSFGLLTGTLRVLMQFVPPDVDLLAIKDDLLALLPVENVHHMHVWQLNDTDTHLEAHIDFSEDLRLSEVATTIEAIQRLLSEKYNICHSVIQPEFGVDDLKQLFVDERH